MMKKTLVAALFSVAAVGAQAALIGGVAANQNPASFIDLSDVGVVTGGALYTGGTIPGIAAIPQNDSPLKATVGTWLAAGPGNFNNSAGGVPADAVVSFGAGTTFASFLWGSPDDYNFLSVTTTAGTTDFAPGFFHPIVLDGDQTFASYLGFTATGGEKILSMTFRGTSNAFEASNFSVTTPVPEPETYALMLAGLAAMGFVARRRKA